MANILHARHPGKAVRVDVTPDNAELHAGDLVVRLSSQKGLRPQSWSG